MVKQTLTAMALSAGVIYSAGAGATPGTSANHDGVWSVRMVTDSGLCDRSYGYTIAIQDGNVRYIPAPGDSPTTVSGKVGPDGNVDLDFRRSIARADAFGRLQASSGTGTWKLNMLGCSGRWTAQRRSATAQAN
jgi:hypothetical protein